MSTREPGRTNPHDYGLAEPPTGKDLQDFSTVSLGQTCPRDCPQGEQRANEPQNDPLGEPLNIREVARLLGCTAWTVRQCFLAEGLPHFRFRRNGKLIFYRNQVIRWVLEKQQQKGGE